MANANKKKSTRKSASTKSSSTVIWILVGILLGVVIAFGFLQWQKQQQQAMKAQKTNTAKSTQTATNTQNVQFDFYQILPGIKPKNYAAEIPVTKNSPTTPVTPVTSNQSFILQIASTKNYAEADRMKAELVLSGYTVNVQAAKLNNDLTYRVIIGPFTSLDAAKAVQKRLQNDKISSILIKNSK